MLEIVSVGACQSRIKLASELEPQFAGAQLSEGNCSSVCHAVQLKMNWLLGSARPNVFWSAAETFLRNWVSRKVSWPNLAG